jgi:hypothetical protein
VSIVYILTNESMPGYIKIGRTETSVEQRMRELDKTPVPLPFQCYYAAKVEDYVTLEKALHTAFGDHRVRSNREFFKLDPYRAKVIVELLAISEVTPGGDVFEDEESAKAVERASKVSGRFNFLENGIPIGSTLVYASDPSITCQVQDEQNVIFDGQVVSPSRAALMANASRGGKATAMQGPIWWLYNGETLASIRDQRSESEG